jgi:outer membrane biosynthesis protein TonB
VMRVIAKIRLLKAPRLPSVAGNGLPERMRTTAFAFLGLTAAAGLALVAIFAQLSFHVLSPVPLPDEPANGGTVAEAVPLHRAVARVPAVTQRREAPAAVGDEGGGGAAEDGSGDSDASEVPVPAAPGEGGVAPESADESTPKPASTSAPAPSAAPQEGSTSEPAPSPAPKPAPTPARPTSPTPAAPPAPGNSQSSAAAAHAGDRGVEASSKSTASVEAPPPATSSSSPSPEDTAPGNGNGKALGQTK